MSSLPSLDPSTAERLSWTLVHFCWQGVALAAGLWVVLAVMRLRNARPRYRYLVCCGCLVCMTAAPVVTYACLDGSVYDPGPLVLPAAVQVGPPAAPAANPPTWGQRTSLRLREKVHRYAGPLTITWAAAVGALGVFQLFRLTLLQRSVRATSSELPAEWEGLRSIPAKVGVAYPVSIVVSTLVDAPATLGWLKPVVLIPASILSGLPVDVVEAFVAHELAHVRRWDYLVNLLQAALETLLWWHPAVWWVSGRVRDEREHCCDELAAGVSGGRVKYAKALTALEDLRVRTPQFAIGSKGGSLVARVTRLVGAPVAKRNRRNRGGVAAVFSAIALATLLTARVSSSAASDPPTRGIDQVQSLCGAVYQILDVHPPAEGQDRLWLERLDAAIAAERGDGDARREDEDRFVQAMFRNSAPDQLGPEILARVHFPLKFAYASSPGWTHGTEYQRVKLAGRLWANAKALRAGNQPDRAVAFARATLLLNAQETYFTGAASLHYLFTDPEFEQLAGLDARQSIQLRRHVEDHDAISHTCLQHRQLASDAIAELAKATDPGTERRVTDAIDAMVTLVPGRPDLQWIVAETAAQLFAARSSPCGMPATAWAQQWGARLPNEPHFARWMAEAAANPAKVRGPRVVPSKDLRPR